MIKKINITLIVILFGFISETALNLFGRLALIENDFSKAKFFLSFIMNRELMGYIYYKQDKFEDAYNYYKQRQDWRGMGWAYYGMGKYEEAQDYFNRVNDYAGLGQVKLAQGNLEEAQAIFSRTNEYSGIGLTYLANSDYENAIQSFERAGDIFGLGLTYFAKGDFDSARKVFSSSKNKTVQGIRLLVDNKYSEAAAIFEKINDLNLLAAFNWTIGNYDKAIDLYLQNNNQKLLAKSLLFKGQIASSYDLFEKNEDTAGLGDVYALLGDFERAYELYDKNMIYEKAFNILKSDGNIQQAMKYASTLIRKNPDNSNIKFYQADCLRQIQEYKQSEDIITGLKLKGGAEAVKANILRARLELSRGNAAVLPEKLQETIEMSGPGFLTKELIKAASMRGIKLKEPAEDSISVMVTGHSEKIIKLVIFVIIGISVVMAFMMFIRKKSVSQPKFEDIKLSPGDVPSAHKMIYSSKTSLNLSTVNKIQKSSATPPSAKKSTTPAKTVTEQVSSAQKEGLEKSGVQILQIALKKLGVNSTAYELMELAGENAGMLTVYGIYLAARAKGVQVQGIKVDISYLLEGGKGLHLVFFNDEKFGILNTITKEKIEICTGPDITDTYTLDEFKNKWNGYVIVLSN